MNASLLPRLVASWLLISAWLPGAPQAAAAKPAPGVVEVVRHYADLMACGTRLTTPASHRFAGVTPTSRPAGNASPEYSVSLTLALPACEVKVFLDRQQRLADVSIAPLRPTANPNRLAKYVPRAPARLVRLGEMRCAFGPGTNATAPEAAGEYYFAYQPAPDARKLSIQAFLSSDTRADSAVMERIATFIAPTQ